MSHREVKDQAHSEWVRRLAQTRAAVRAGLFRVESSMIGPTVAVVTSSSNPLLDLHVLVVDYAGQLRPYRGDVTALWTEQLGTALVPAVDDEEHDVPPQYEHVRHRGKQQVKPAKTILPVSLEEIDQWRHRIVQLPNHRGETTTAKVVLPPRACSQLYEQLGEVLRELNLTAEVEAVAGADGALGIPEHIRAEAPAYKQESD